MLCVKKSLFRWYAENLKINTGRHLTAFLIPLAIKNNANSAPPQRYNHFLIRASFAPSQTAPPIWSQSPRVDSSSLLTVYIRILFGSILKVFELRNLQIKFIVWKHNLILYRTLHAPRCTFFTRPLSYRLGSVALEHVWNCFLRDLKNVESKWHVVSNLKIFAPNQPTRYGN